ncbi:MAG: NAD(P)/FAD-dependent oxidoreductase [Candidatus Bipolaricaulota bacterium]|nr:MAG: NAD(P)/FAD-dependent oxidoreductase [Candidatus Bipolaricaulota bacterium]
MAPPRYDVAVIGGGTAGAVAAREAARSGARTVLIDVHPPEHGRPVCAGLVSPGTPQLLEIPASVVRGVIRGAVIHGPAATRLHLRGDEPKAVVIDRAAARAALLSLACAEGAELLAPARATAVMPGVVKMELPEGTAEIEAAVVIGADGPASTVARCLGLSPPDPVLSSLQVTIPVEERVDDEVRLFVGRDVAPGFFAWTAPAEEGRLRVGLACVSPHRPEPFLRRLLEERYPEAGSDDLALESAPIPLGPPPETVADGGLLVGDAAGQVKPLSGGGISTGARCAKLAGRLAAWAALARRTTRGDLAVYEGQWRREIGAEIAFGKEIHRMRCALTDDQLAAALRAADEPSLLALVAEKADIDRPSRLLEAFVGRQELWPRLLGIVTAVGGWQSLSALLREAVRLVRPRNL